MKTIYKIRAEIVVLKRLLLRKRRGDAYRPQVGEILIAENQRFHVRIDNLPPTPEPFASILKGSDYRVNSMGRDLVGGYIIVERLGDETT